MNRIRKIDWASKNLLSIAYNPHSMRIVVKTYEDEVFEFGPYTLPGRLWRDYTYMTKHRYLLNKKHVIDGTHDFSQDAE